MPDLPVQLCSFLPPLFALTIQTTAMKKTVTLLTLLLLAFNAPAQSSRKVSVYLQAQYTGTIADRTSNNNPWALGTGLHGFVNTGHIRPMLDLTADAYLYDDKVARLDENGEVLEDIGGVVNLFGGVSFHPYRQMYVSLAGGPSLINGRTLAGIKPSFGVYFTPKQRWSFRISYIHVFNREPTSKLDFSSVSFALGLRLF